MSIGSIRRRKKLHRPLMGLEIRISKFGTVWSCDAYTHTHKHSDVSWWNVRGNEVALILQQCVCFALVRVGGTRLGI